jgi:hypothetical protein
MRQLAWAISLAVAAGVSAFTAHHFSSSHYFDLGMSRGNIDARIAVIREIDALLPNARLCSESDYKEWKEIVSVKSWAVYGNPIDTDSVSVCRAR